MLYEISLQYDADQHKLTYLGSQPPPIVYTKEDEVSFTILNRPANWVPALSITSNGVLTAYGPFLDMHVQGSTLTCEGFAGGSAQLFECTPLLLAWDDASQTLTTASADLPVQIERPAGFSESVQKLLVTLLPDAKIHVSPSSPVTVAMGDVVQWEFQFVNESAKTGWPVVAFYEYFGPDPQPPTSGLGPFTDLRMDFLSPSGPDRFNVIGSGNNLIAGVYRYVIGLLSADSNGRPVFRRLVRVNREGQPIHDPVIDNSGGPPAAARGEVRAEVLA